MGSRIKENPESTFDVYVEVMHPGKTGSNPEVRRQFPEDFTDQETLQTISKFCFPFSMDSLTVNQVGQNFTFVLTDIESKQRFGFCRLSSGSQSCFCILSYLPWFEVFYKLLNILADYTIKSQESQWRELLEALHSLPIPDPGVPVHLSVHTYFTVPDLRELPSIPENRNLTEYFVAVDVNNMLHLYASMLYERRIIICCSKLSTLTACVHGSAAMLYPMYWQHVYIPVLPPHLLDYCCAPMPYLIGVHSSLMEKVKSMALEDVVLLNVDTNTLETPFDDLQSLPNDVVSSLKSRLKKVSTTTGDGVARAFLKAQAALFGSYRSALHIESEEPITFNEEAFVTHRSSTMRQFLQNAIQLQLFKQFIDGRLELLNSGEGFSDVFEEELNMGEYAGSDKNYHQWLSTVKKGSGAILNTVKTKANPAMKTVYKFAKDHAKMGIKEVKSRLKQKDLAENGYGTTADDLHTRAAGSPSVDRKEVRTWDERRPITVHFGQPERVPPPRPPPPRLQRSTRPARPPRPLVVKRPRSNVALDSCRPSASTPEQPQPYRSLKEADVADMEDMRVTDRRQGHTAPPSPVAEKLTEVDLLGDIFSCVEGETEDQPFSLAKSLEDLRTANTPEESSAKFSYQRMDLGTAEHTRTLPGLKHSHPYNKLWSLGQDDMALPSRATPSWERPLSVPPSEPAEHHAAIHERGGASQDKVDSSVGGASHANITIPRPHGRKTPEPGKVLVPPVPLPRAPKHVTADSGVTPGRQEFRQALNMSSVPHTSTDILKPVKVSSDSMDLLSLLDPLSSTTGPTSGPQGAPQTGSGECQDSKASGTPTLSFSHQGIYPQTLPPIPQSSLNPFTQTPHYAPLGPPHRHYTPSVAVSNPFCTTYVPPATGYFQQQAFSVPSMFGQPPSVAPGFIQATPSPAKPACSPAASPSLLDCALAQAPCSRETPPSLTKPPQAGDDLPEPHDPFGDLLAMPKPAPPPKRRVEDLRRQWETFD
ncbi:DENN domain-containing protein 1A isoform X3 [Scleropages formosus]|uniref:DENN domain containing 1A n=1 Tax=Scleropages formosus TaxID=113540 RepID=A0A8C9RNG5_SCLFO|nr:DENN domain-containing protein 1A isoform X3 [Scleropages formosus]